MRDKSGNGINLAEVTTVSGPTFSRTAINFSPGSVTGARPGLIYTTNKENFSSVPVTTNALSSFVVFQFGSGSSVSFRITGAAPFGGATADNAGIISLLAASGSGANLGNYYGGYKVDNFAPHDATIGQAHVAVGISTGSNVYVRCDGYQSSVVAFAQTSQTLYPRMGVNTDVYGLHGAIGECLWTKLDPTLVIDKIEGYLAWKWGLVDQLNPAHPYKNRPPTIGG